MLNNGNKLSVAVSISSIILFLLTIASIIYASGKWVGWTEQDKNMLNERMCDHENRIRRLEEIATEQRIFFRAFARKFGLDGIDTLK